MNQIFCGTNQLYSLTAAVSDYGVCFTISCPGEAASILMTPEQADELAKSILERGK